MSTMKVHTLLMLVVLGLSSRVQSMYLEPHEHSPRTPSDSPVQATCATTGRDIKNTSADVFCPSGCLTNGRSVWGTDVYTDDSSICRAAIHAGVIPNDGGRVSVQKTPGQTSYTGSTRYGVSTNNYGPWPGSFLFVNSTSPVTPESTKEATQKPQVTISCTTTARDITGPSADVLCPAGCLSNGRTVWGTDVYTDDSAICRAAIHAGKIPKDGGQVSVQKTSGQSSYTGSTRYGVSTNNYGAWSGSFIFISTNPVTLEPTKETTQWPPVTASCTTTARDITGSSADVLCPAGCLTDGRSVWGTDVYTDDSSICRAAIHAGIIPNDGGQVSVQKTSGEASYSGSTRNGISTRNYGPWTGSFIFVSSTSPVTPEPTKGITERSPVTISCTTTARDITGPSADVLCPAGCLSNGRSVWGTDVYTDDSAICRAAIHAGKIPKDGGQVSVQKTSGQSSYTGSTRYEVSTNNYGAWSGSFIFISTSPGTPAPTKETTQWPPVTASCTTTARDITGSSADVLCPAGCLTNGRSVWGTDVYTDDSSICRAAIHAGIIPNDGGRVSMQKTSGEASYSGSTRNGISTRHYGPWTGSFIFVTSTSPVTPELTKGITERSPVTASCTTTARDITGSSADVLCPAGCLANGKSVWGTAVYTDDSSICRAAIHAGKIPNDGGRVTVQKTSGEGSYNGSTRNGVSTNNYGAWPRSFIFISTSPETPEPTIETTQRPPVTASCTTTARDLPGSSANVLCPADCLTNGGSIWGTDVYTDDSSICRAAIHAGKIPSDGGRVSVQKAPGQSSYSGSTRNGITTNYYGGWSGSFIFVVSTSPVTPEQPKEITQMPPVTASCTTTARDITGSSADVLCPADCLVIGRSVWGSGVYTDDSSICRAAIHSGKILNNGGQVSVQKTPGQASYSGSTENGISSNNYGPWPRSFMFVTLTSPVTLEPAKEVTQRPPVQASCSTTARDLQESFTDVQCPPGCLGSEKSVWGTDFYTDDSSICRAAIHCGALTNNGGQMKVKKKPGQPAYRGSTNNGVISSSYGTWPGSFVLHKV